MWESPAVILCLAIVLSAAETGFPRLPAPTNLRLDRRTVNDKDLLEVHWKFVEPPNLQLRKIEFALLLEASNATTRKHYFKVGSGRLIYKIWGLSPGTKYTVKLRATSPNWEDSEDCIERFKTQPAGSLSLAPPWGLRIYRSIEKNDKVPETFEVHWNFEAPPYIELRDVEFVLSLQAEGKPKLRLFASFSSAPFKYTVRNLPPGTQYSLKIKATCPNCKECESLVEHIQTKPFAFPQLAAPTNLRLNRSTLNAEESVVVDWDFEKPSNLSLSRIEFVLLLEGQGKDVRKFHAHVSNAPFGYTIRGLSPKTKYILKIMATSPNWQTSESSFADFVSFPVDWPTPTITSVKSEIRDNFVEYAVEWKVKPMIGMLHHFEVRICDRHCFSYWWNSTKAQVPVEFNSAVNITVVALFDARSTKFVERESERYTGQSPKGEPGKILETIAEKSGNAIALAWHPPFHPLGPMSYYEVIACDSSRGQSGFRDEKTISQSENPYIPHLSGSAQVVRFSPHLPKATAATPTDNASASDVDPCKPPKSLLLAVFGKEAKGCANFRIIFDKPDIDEYYRIDHGTCMRQLFLKSGVAESFNFSPNERFSLRIRSCITHVREKCSSCGTFTEFELQSNVGAPGLVRDAQMYYGFFGSLVVTWDIPDKPRGPIDGFRIEIETDTGSVKPGIETLTLDADLRSMVLSNLTEDKRFWVRIAAFNLDHEDRTKELIGDWYTFIPPDSHKFGKLIALVIMCILIVTVPVLSLKCSSD